MTTDATRPWWETWTCSGCFLDFPDTTSPAWSGHDTRCTCTQDTEATDPWFHHQTFDLCGGCLGKTAEELMNQ